ncbi:MAG TPA: hypothetical protein VGI29_10115 [Candidatus Binataceae bacterium]
MFAIRERSVREREFLRFSGQGWFMRYGVRYGWTRKGGADGRARTVFGAAGGAAMLGAAVLAALAAGCSSQASPAAASAPSTALSSASGIRSPSSPPAPSLQAAGSPQVITNLSQLSSAETDAASLNTAAKVLKTDPAKDEAAAAVAHGLGRDSPSTLRRLFLDHPESPRYAETMIPHTQIRLLDAKAAEFSGFSNMMLTQLLSEMIKEEHQDPMVSLELSEETKPVVLTAILDDKGQLRELIYQQHSGLAAIDNFVVGSCKESLWANNMPTGALSKNGDYRLRIEAQVSKYSADRQGNQTFTTRLGLGIL